MKGLFYSIMIALFIIPILALITFYSQTISPQNIDANIRADELQYFSNSIEEDLSRFLQINGKRALISAVSRVVTTGTPLDDSSLRLTEVIDNGTMYGNKIFSDQRNLTMWEDNISAIAAGSGFNLSFSGASVDVTQGDSFNVLFTATIYNVNISDVNVGMGILKNISVSSAVSLDGMEDPIFPLKTGGSFTKSIGISPFNKIASPFTDLGNLTLDIKNGYYHSSTKGASFLERLEGKVTTTDCAAVGCGLESFIYLPDLTGSYQSSTLSDLDYQYWTNARGYLLNSGSRGYDPVYQWFRIGNLADNDYGINSLLDLTT